jgi:hypothetical protein
LLPLPLSVPAGAVALGDVLRAVFAAHPALVLLERSAALLSLVALLASAWVGYAYPQARRAFARPGVFLALCVLTTLLWRLPALLHYELNCDESQVIAAARTLIHDPYYWVSVDLGSHGPLPAYALLLPHLFGLEIDLAATRLTGLALLLGCLISLYGLFRTVYPEGVARLLTLPFALFLATITYPDMAAYNAEQPTIFLLLLGACFAVRAGAVEVRNRPLLLFGAGVALGLVPFSKLQGVPIAAAVTLSLAGWLIQSGGRRPAVVKPLLAHAAGLLAPALAWAVVYGTKGALALAWDAYIGYNLAYADRHPIPLLARAWELRSYYAKHLFVTSPFWYCWLLSSAAIGAWLLARGKKEKVVAERPEQRPVAPSLVPGAALCLLAAVYAILKPGNGFPHYFYFLLPPVAALSGAVWGPALVAGRRGGATFRGYAVCCVLLPLTLHGALLHKRGWKTQSFQVEARERTDAAAAIRAHLRPGEPLGMWGHDTRYYAMADAEPASRYSSTCMIDMFAREMQKQDRVARVTPGQRRGERILNTYLDDLKRTRPRVFIDTLPPDAKTDDGALCDYTAFPPLRAWIERNYAPVGTVEGVRIFILREPDEQQVVADRP